MKFCFSDITRLLSPEGRKFFLFICRTAGYWPHNISLYETAFTHRSAANFKHTNNNERLEYLGDAILDMLVAEILFRKMPKANEGRLTSLRAMIVSRKHLNGVAKKLEFCKKINYKASHNISNTHLPGDALEAFVAAMYLDGGLRVVRRFVRKHIANDESINTFMNTGSEDNYKSRLLEWGQHRRLQIVFDTRVVDVDGSKVPAFCSDVVVDGHWVASGEGRAKKQAEQNAAYSALLEVDKIFPIES